MKAVSRVRPRRDGAQVRADRAERESLARYRRLAALARAIREAERRADSVHRLELRLSRPVG